MGCSETKYSLSKQDFSTRSFTCASLQLVRNTRAKPRWFKRFKNGAWSAVSAITWTITFSVPRPANPYESRRSKGHGRVAIAHQRAFSAISDRLSRAPGSQLPARPCSRVSTLRKWSMANAITIPIWRARSKNPQAWEKDMPKDIILVHLTASPEVIKQRMKDDPHDFPPCTRVGYRRSPGGIPRRISQILF